MNAISDFQVVFVLLFVYQLWDQPAKAADFIYFIHYKI